MKKRIKLNHSSLLSGKFVQVSLLVLLALLAFTSKSYCDMSSKQFQLSNLLKNSMLVAKGKIVQVTSGDNYYKMSFSVEDILLGTINSNNIEVVSRFKNGFRLEDEPYLEEGNEYILFLNNTKGWWTITNRIAGVLSVNAADDLKKVIQDYKLQENLFDKGNCRKLISLFDKVETEYIKNLLLLDIEENITAKEVGFIKKMFDKSDSKSKIFGIRNAGKLKIKEMHEPIKDALIAETNTENNFEYLFALENYADKNDAKIAAKYLNDKAQGIRSVAINVLRQIGTEEIIELLINNYKVEPNWSNRIVILDALKKFKNDDRVIKAVDDFLVWENNVVVKNNLLTIAKNEWGVYENKNNIIDSNTLYLHCDN